MKQLLAIIMLLVSVSPAIADSTEVTSPIAVISPFTYWPTSPGSGRFYRPTGVRVGNEYFLYVQGGAYRGVSTGPGSASWDCPEIGEKALAFKAPWTASGLRSPFTYVRSVSPCNLSAPPHVHYQTGSAFISSTDGRVKLTIDETEGGSSPRHGHFKRVLLGSSTDGKNFTWSTFLKQSVVNGVTYSIDDVILVQATANTNWWGVFRWAWCIACNGTDGEGFWRQGRIRVVMDATNPRGFVAYLLDQNTGGWSRVNDDGSFNFVPLVTWETPWVKSIIYNNGTWEAWRGDGGTPNGGCDDGDPNSSSTFAYQTVNQAGGAGANQVVTSTTRAMPTQHGGGRLDPFRMQDMNGKRLLYSHSSDRMCFEGRLAGGRGVEILVTEVNN